MIPTKNAINKVIELTGKSYLEVLPVVESARSEVEAVAIIKNNIQNKYSVNYLTSYRPSKIKKGMIIVVEIPNLSGLPRGFITKASFICKENRSANLDCFNPFKGIYNEINIHDPSVILIESLLPQENRYFLYLNKPTCFEYICNIRCATAEEKKLYRKIRNHLSKEYGD